MSVKIVSRQKEASRAANAIDDKILFIDSWLLIVVASIAIAR